MRRVATLQQPVSGVLRLMLYTKSGDGTYVFLYDREEDGPCSTDNWFDTFQEADDYCSEEFGVQPSDWQEIPDPVPGYQHDWIRPTRVKKDQDGNPLWGQFEGVE